MNKKSPKDADSVSLSKSTLSKNKERAGIRSVDENTDIIEKGSRLDRVANSDEKIDHRPKYMSLTDDDRSTYSEMFDMLDADWQKPMSSYSYSSKKDLTVATGKQVLEDILQTYGDTKINTLFKDAKEVGSSSMYDERNLSKCEKKYFEDANKEMSKFLIDTMHNNKDEIVKKYLDKKYDAIVDVEDWYHGVAEYPIIMLDPGKSIRLKNELKYWW